MADKKPIVYKPLWVKLSPDEHHYIKVAAAQADLSMQDLVRGLLIEQLYNGITKEHLAKIRKYLDGVKRAEEKARSRA